jgi:hypothetical protein
MGGAVPTPFAKVDRFEQAMIERLEEEAGLPKMLEEAVQQRLSVGTAAEEVRRNPSL